MKILKTLVMISDDGSIYTCDTIEHEGNLWLVPEWRADSATGIERPSRIIGLHGLPLQKPGPNYQGDFLLPIPLSRATLAGSTAQGLVVIEAPDIARSVGGGGSDRLQ